MLAATPDFPVCMAYAELALSTRFVQKRFSSVPNIGVLLVTRRSAQWSIWRRRQQLDSRNVPKAKFAYPIPVTLYRPLLAQSCPRRRDSDSTPTQVCYLKSYRTVVILTVGHASDSVSAHPSHPTPPPATPHTGKCKRPGVIREMNINAVTRVARQLLFMSSSNRGPLAGPPL